MTGRRRQTAIEGVSFDLFGTLVTVATPDDPAAAVATELEARDVPVPNDWGAAYTESHVDVPSGAELSLVDHVWAALSSRSHSSPRANRRDDVAEAVLAAFDAPVRTRPGAVRAVETIAARLPVGVLSNCSVPTLVERTLAESEIDETAFDAVVTSVGCGWRKPNPHAFETVADELDAETEALLHIGDDPSTDGGATAVGAARLLVETVTLAEIADDFAEIADDWGRSV